ncbi:deleted in malignant brain tumors 1, partial [Paramuricea clavata]
ISCGYPGCPQRGFASGSVYTVGSVVYFYCYYSGEVLSGASSTTCQSNGTWSNPTPPRCSSYGIRLVGTSDTNRGRVEIYHPSYGWGTVCDDYLQIADGNVICRQLGYSGASNAYHGAVYGQGTGTILLDDLGCNGYESYIWDCPNLGWTVHNCGHGEDASVDCY